MNSTQNLDYLYYRNKATIANMRTCSNYRFIYNYNSCSQAQVDSTANPTYTNYTMGPTSVPTSATIITGTPTTAPPSS